MTFQTLISAAQLIHLAHSSQEAGDLVVLDCQTNLMEPDQGYAAYRAGHIPGAQHADLDQHGASAAGANGRHPLPDPQDLLQQMRRWGIHNHSQVVVYDSAGGAFAGRFWWCLRWLGHAKVALLDGGLGAFPNPLVQGDDPSRQSSAASAGTATLRRTLTRIADVDEVLLRVRTRTETSANLLDARTQERFDGTSEPIDPVAGHIPGARCLPFQGNLDSNGHFHRAADLAERFANPSTAAQEDPICYCGSGVTAAHNVLALVHAGFEEPLLYPGSWSEWLVDPARPRATG